MSRLEFRAAVAAPRPAAAWVMVSVAAATLWITAQLYAWAMLAQAGALLLSLVLRERPRAWQRSPLALNAGMLAVTTSTIAVALRGHPSLVALAHFAALTQGLQLLDARPRRSEFLLVALALFQVTLAANLTDSVFFIPLLGAFVISTTWTLMVHTLRTEALEAGTPGAQAITPGLLRTTFFVSGVAFVLALVLFLFLPRMRARMVNVTSLAPVLAMAGFSDRVQLGEFGRIRQDPSLVMRVETLQGKAPRPETAYWRGLAFDYFDGRSWLVTPAGRYRVAGVAEVGLRLGSAGRRANLVQRIVREPVSAGVIFGVGEPRHLQGTIRHVERDPNGGLYAVNQARERIRYRFAGLERSWSDAVLIGDTAQLPGADGQRYLQLPSFGTPVAELAARISAGHRTDAARARAIEHYLRETGRYSDTSPALDPSGERSRLETFLFGETAGHCEYFATAMVVLARAIGLPARLVNGFAGGRVNRIGGFVELTRSDAHAWVEVHFRDAGWVRYDPTPPDRRLRAAQAPSALERLREFGSAVELWWFQRVVDFDRSDQLRAMRVAWLAWRGLADSQQGERHALQERLGESRLAELTRRRGPLLALLAGAGLLLGLRLRHGQPRDPLPRAYARALRLLGRRGLQRTPSATARDFARRVRVELPAEAAAAFEALTESYLGERFGGRPGRCGDRELARLRAALREEAAARPQRPRDVPSQPR